MISNNLQPIWISNLWDLMATWFTQSDALGVVTTLFWGSVLTSLASFLTDPYLTRSLKTHWKPLLVCTALVLVWRIPAEGGFFHGLEYEDSYVYTVAGRQMAEQFRIEPSGATLPYSINVCAVGSLTFVQAIRQLSGAFNRVPVYPLCALQSLWIPLIHRLDSERSLRVPRRRF